MSHKNERDYRNTRDDRDDEYLDDDWGDDEYEAMEEDPRDAEQGDHRQREGKESSEDGRSREERSKDYRGNHKRSASEKVEDSDARNNKRRKHRRKRHPILNFFAKFLCLIQTVVTGLVIYGLLKLDFLPMKYNLVIIGVMVVVLLIIWILGMFRGAVPKIFAILLSLAFTIILAMAGFYLYQTYMTLSNITEGKTVTQKDEMVVVVLKDNSYESLEDIAGKTMGVQTTLDTENTQQALEEVNKRLSPVPIKREFDSLDDLVQELYDRGVEAILFNAIYWDMIEEEYETFTDDTRILDTITYEKEVVIETETQDKDITQDTFIIYMSGIDTYGDVSSRSRSDVNILAVVNPVTKQIALITTPRDYYVPIALDGNPMDKLTHAGIYGIDCSISTLENLYDIDIDYYVRLNFTGFMDIVDALGGVEVYSSQTFTAGGVTFTEGYNEVNGEAALSFVRERHSFVDGDFQRQRNQMEMIKAIIKKVASPTILTSYTSLLDSIQNSFNTDMSRSEIGELVKMQLDDGGDWSISSYGVTGEGTTSTTYSMGSRQLYVCLMDDDSIATAKEWIDNIKNGVIMEDGKAANGDQ